MSLALTVRDYIASQIVTLIGDTNLFHGGFPDDAPDISVNVEGLPGGSENESGIISTGIQIIARALDYEGAESWAYAVYNELANQPGFDGMGSEDVKYCEVLQMPYFAMKDARNRYLFITTFLMRKE